MYTKPEVIEIGEAIEVILGTKDGQAIDEDFEPVLPNGDLDD